MNTTDQELERMQWLDWLQKVAVKNIGSGSGDKKNSSGHIYESNPIPHYRSAKLLDRLKRGIVG